MVSLFSVIRQVLFSWQVIVITVTALLYIMLVSWVARSRRRARVPKRKKKKDAVSKKAAPAASGSTEPGGSGEEEIPAG